MWFPLAGVLGAAGAVSLSLFAVLGMMGRDTGPDPGFLRDVAPGVGLLVSIGLLETALIYALWAWGGP